MQFLYILAEREGLFFFHFFTLLALQAGLLLAYSLRKRPGNEGYFPPFVAFASILLIRVLLLTARITAPAFGFQAVLVFPPLERLGEIFSLAFLLWAFAFPASRPAVRNSFLFLISLMAAFIYLADAFTWISQPAAREYNFSIRAMIWGLLGAILGLGGVMSALIGSGDPLSAGFFLTFSLGHLLQALNPQGVQGMPLWVRWAEIVGYPLLVLPLLRDFLKQLQVPELFQTAEALSFVKFYEAASKGTFSLDLPVVMENVAVGIARAFEAPGSFVLIVDDENPELAHIAVFSGGGIKRFQVALTRNPFLEEALRSQGPALVQDFRTLHSWEQILGVKPLSLILAPVISRDVPTGLVGAWFGEVMPFLEWQARLLRSIVREMRLAIERARIYRSLERKIEDLSWEIRRKEKDLARYEAIIKEAKEHRKEEAREIFDRLAFLEKRARELEAELERARREAEEAKAQAMAEATRAKALQEQLKGFVEKGKPSHELLSSLPIGLIMADSSGKITWGNEAAEEILGWPLREFSGQPLSNLVEDPRWLSAVEKVLGGESRAVISLELGKKILRAELARHGSGITLALSDVTAEVEALKTRDRFIASLASDIRNPLSVIIGYTELLLSESVGLVGEMQRNFLLKIKSAVEKLHRIVNDLLNLAAIDSGSFSLRFTLVEVEEIVGETVSLVRAQMESAEVKLDVKIQEGLPPVEVDFESMRYVLSTLLSNAIACSPSGSTIRLEITAEPPEGEPHYLKIKVTDAGGGLSPEELSQVFTRFAFPDQALIRGLGEKGVGLSLSKTIVELHGGRIWAESSMGVGTTFFVLLPLRQRRFIPGEKEWKEEDSS
ncbi:MAG: ATP-binding protein [Anaerolineae bacterium]|nr:ATP-binding protein [Anaerolineae bacterium]MDW8103061.1 ATP-binding protein [Anaerolineae bacterium]